MTITEAAADHVEALKRAGTAYARKQRAADTARETLVIVIRYASAGGMTKTAIAETAGVARETVYKALRGTPAAGEGGATVTADGADLPGDLATGDRLAATS